MTVSTLTPARVAGAASRKNIYSIRDRKLKGFLLRVTPSGHKSYVIEKRYGLAACYETIGDASTISLDEARTIARQKIEAFTLAARPQKTAPQDICFEVMAELTLGRYRRLWKPTTMKCCRQRLKSQIMPFFEGRRVVDITRADVMEWFASLGHAPGGANRCVPLLSVIMREAEDMGIRPEGSNPVSNMRRYKIRKRERVLTASEMVRLNEALRKSQKGFPLQAAILRLLILTGCRKSEIMTLCWQDYRDGHLCLRDSKTGPKTVFLSAPARAVLDRVKTKRDSYIFPGRRPEKPIASIDVFWKEIKAAAGIEDVRLHDLRHTYASIAIRSGESITTIGQLLGHSCPTTTLRYAHLDDGMMHRAVEQISDSMSLFDGF